MLLLCYLTVAIMSCWYLLILYKHFRKIKVITTEHTKEVKFYQQAPGPLPWPILGNLHLLVSQKPTTELLTDLSKKFGSMYSLTLGATKCIVINNLELIKEVLNQNGKFFGGRPNFIRYHQLFGGDRNNSLALCDWSILQKKRRNLARKHCSPRDTSPYFIKMSNVGCSEIKILIEKLNETINNNKQIPIKSFVQRACANMFFQYMCSVRFEYNDHDFCEVVDFFDEIFWEINQGYAVDFLPWLAPFYKNHMSKLIHWSSTIRSFILKRIINKRDELNSSQPQDDFTDALLNSLMEDKKVSRDTILFMLEDFIGGHSAVGNLVMLTLIYLIKHPNVAKKIQLEADSVSSKGQRIISFYDTDSMPFTMATIFEVLRCSSSPIVPHVATEDTVICGYGVAKDTIVFINNYNLNHNKLYWKKPNCFQPERFLEYSTEKNEPKPTMNVLRNCEKSVMGEAFRNTISKTKNEVIQIRKNMPYFLPFSIGKRTCIGQNLVRGFGFILVANILRQFNVYYENGNNIEINIGCIALPAKPIPIALVKRNKNI
ncbi:cytochrome P450 307a1-like [Bactrocera neohumeralis]|uniref:cytochrome P450 307a1-like n=1 Tax=Bactrocera tryoni TaxID=59916 RepID=UPI001A970288|nr:cytochrome P450 307a1-like [Bactrocera tryoni]XP_050337770.1 cytochrome P450 307a1-like [Bactrocera neohumeralis]